MCNPKFVCKNNWYFDLSSTYFLYPLTSIPKMVKQEMPASIGRANSLFQSPGVGPPLFSKINIREMFAGLCMMRDDAADTHIETDQRSRVHSEASLTLETFGDIRTTNTRHR